MFGWLQYVYMSFRHLLWEWLRASWLPWPQKQKRKRKDATWSGNKQAQVQLQDTAKRKYAGMERGKRRFALGTYAGAKEVDRTRGVVCSTGMSLRGPALFSTSQVLGHMPCQTTARNVGLALSREPDRSLSQPGRKLAWEPPRQLARRPSSFLAHQEP